MWLRHVITSRDFMSSRGSKYRVARDYVTWLLQYHLQRQSRRREWAHVALSTWWRHVITSRVTSCDYVTWLRHVTSSKPSSAPIPSWRMSSRGSKQHVMTSRDYVTWLHQHHLELQSRGREWAHLALNTSHDFIFINTIFSANPVVENELTWL